MVKMKRVSFWCPVSDLEILKRHGINVSEVCRDAMTVKANMIIKEESPEERRRKLLDQVALVDKQMEKQVKTDKVLNELLGELKERHKKIVDILSIQISQYGKLSLPEVHRLCDLSKVNYDEFLLDLPVEWEGLKTERTLDEIAGSKPYKDEEGRTQRTGFL